MKNPVHPGSIVRHDCLEPLDLSVTDAAKLLGVTRQALNNVVNEKAGISPEMAIRRSKAFGSTPHTWVQMQAAFDLALGFLFGRQIGGRFSRVSDTSEFAWQDPLDVGGKGGAKAPAN